MVVGLDCALENAFHVQHFTAGVFWAGDAAHQKTWLVPPLPSKDLALGCL